MKITDFELRLVSIPYEKPVKWANVIEESTDAVLLRINTDEGIFGLSQKKIYPQWSGSTSRSVAVELKEIYEPLLCGQDPLRSERTWAILGGIPGWSSSKMLIDVALCDIAARAAGLPMWKYLGGWTDEVAVSGLVSRGPAEQRIDEMRQLRETYGFGAFKVKIGTDRNADVAYIDALRKAFGDELVLRVDANSGYTTAEAVYVATALAEYGILDFEDPCPLEGRAARAALFSQMVVPIVVDRFASSHVTAVSQVIGEGAGGVAIKTARHGYRLAREILSTCQEAGAVVVVGTNADSTLGALIGLHLHAAHRYFQMVPAEDSFFATLKDSLFPTPAIRDGKVKLSSEPGLVGGWDEEKLQHLSSPIAV